MPPREVDIVRTRRAGIALALLLASQSSPTAAQMPDIYADDDIWLMEESTQGSPEDSATDRAEIAKHPDTEHSASITPNPMHASENDRTCREYQQRVTIGGRPQQAYGTACRRSDGVWEILRSE